jgi:TetR/AcrR family transcriptional repressor of nem operon
VRYSQEHKRESRLRIVRAAAQRFRQLGFSGAGIDEVMRAAGLTAGAFYAHFESKQHLLAEALEHALAEPRLQLVAGLEGKTGAAWLGELVRRYLSRAHRDAVAEGCPVPALAGEVGRQGTLARQAFERELGKLLAEAAEACRSIDAPADEQLSSEDRALAVMALCAGGIMLARSVQDRGLSDRILRACRRFATPGMERS